MHEQIVCAGFGGQGIMLMGKLLAECGMRQGYNVTWLPSYGAEVRGGTAHSMVHIAERPIASPTITHPTACIAMNKPSFLKFIDKVEKGGLFLFNASMVGGLSPRKSVKLVGIPFSRLAADLGNVKTANMIALGAFIRFKKIFPIEALLEGLDNILQGRREAILINKEALKLGYAYVK